MPDKSTKTIWYKQPGKRFMEGLPLGNGRLGAMVFGGSTEETILLDESTCLSGGPSDENVQPGAAALIPQIREALFRQEYTRAHALAEGIIGLKHNYGTNLPFGFLRLAFDHGAIDPTSYRRELCLNNGIASIFYQVGEVDYTREIFASNPAQVIALRLATSQPGQLTFSLSLDGGDKPFQTTVDTATNDLIMAGHAFETVHSDGKSGVAFQARVHIVPQGGELVTLDSKLEVRQADAAIIYIALGTTFGGNDPETVCRQQIEAAASQDFETLRQEHAADFQSLFDRVEFELGPGPDSEIPTDDWLASVKGGQYDPSFTAMMFHYGRYLFIASSRENSPLPAHLQGVWNDNEACRMGWTCDLHLDINTQMNYWAADVTNLTELTQPLTNWLESTLVPSGRKTAKELYGLGGWVAHTVSNAWGYSAPGWAVGWGIDPFCGVWIASHLWETYRFSLDQTYLAEHVYPLIRETAEFVQSYLVEDPSGRYLLPGPSFSPENSFIFDDSNYSVDMGVTYATVMARNLFQSGIEAAAILSVDTDLRTKWAGILEKLPPFQVGQFGQLQEWLHDYTEADPRHRHISHLLAVYPYGQIDPELTPTLAEAVHVTLMRRLYTPIGYEETGWARCVALVSAARLWNGEEALQQIHALERRLTEVNLLTFDPPGAGATLNILELDGNTGMTAGIAEMLLQSHQDNIIHLLPSLPRVWKEGHIRGLKARGGLEIEIEWRNGKLVRARITSLNGRTCRIRYGSELVELPTQAGTSYQVDKDLIIH